jgi:hypothetical protein
MLFVSLVGGVGGVVVRLGGRVGEMVGWWRWLVGGGGWLEWM